jgi:hypothetical protein
MAQLDGQIQDVQSSIRELETRARGLKEQKARLTAQLNRLKAGEAQGGARDIRVRAAQSAQGARDAREEARAVVRRRNAERLGASTVACWLLHSRPLAVAYHL